MGRGDHLCDGHECRPVRDDLRPVGCSAHVALLIGGCDVLERVEQFTESVLFGLLVFAVPVLLLDPVVGDAVDAGQGCDRRRLRWTARKSWIA